MQTRELSRVVSGLLLALNCGPALSQDSLKDRFVRAGNEAFGLLPPELVYGPTATQAKWSSDSRYVLAVCRAERVGPLLAKSRAIKRDPGEPPGDLSLIVWSRDSHTSHEVWRRPLAGALVEDFWWLPASSTAVAVVQETIRSVPCREVISVRADASIARVIARIQFNWEPLHRVPHRRLGLASPSDYVDISPSKPLCLAKSWQTETEEVALPNGTKGTVSHHQYDLTPVRDDGSPAPTIRLPVDVFPVTWNKSGDICYLLHSQRSSDPKQRSITTYFEFDPRTGKIRQLQDKPADWNDLLRSRTELEGPEKPAHWPVRVVLEPKQTDATNRARPLWLEATTNSKPTRVLISPDASWYQLSPDEESILYFSHGAAWVRRQLRVSGRELAAMLDEEARRQAVADADELANALQDLVESEERFPTMDTLNDRLGAYLANKELLGRIVYTCTDRIRSINADVRARTQLGYVNGPGGRAIIFADGHTIWRDD